MNYYETLQVSINACDEIIAMAYQVLTKKYNPDSYAGDREFAEQQIKLINSAYAVLSNEQARKAYNKQMNYTAHEILPNPCKLSETNPEPVVPVEANPEHTQPVNDVVRSFIYQGHTVPISKSLAEVTAWRAALAGEGLAAAQNYISSYKSIMNGYGKVQSFVGKDLINIGLDLFCYHVDNSILKGITILTDNYGHQKIDTKKVRAYLTDYVKDYFEGSVRYYKKLISSGSTRQLSSVELSNMAYKVYTIYITVINGATNYLRKIGALTLPATTIEEATFSINCENDARSGKIIKGDTSLLEQLLNLVILTPYRVESYCILYFLYGDVKKELEEIAAFFGMKKQYTRYRESYCKHELRVEEKVLFYVEASRSYTPINWEIFGAFYAFYREFERQCGVTDSATVNGFIEAASDEIREYLYYTPEKLFSKTCTNENDPFSSSSVFWAAMALLSRHLDKITEQEYYAWANQNPSKLKDALLKYYAFATKSTPHTSLLSSQVPHTQVATASKTPIVEGSSHAAKDALGYENESKQFIDAALQNNLMFQVWTEAEKGNAYAEYALQQYYQNLCEAAIKAYDSAEMERILSDVYQRAKSGNMCAAFIFAYLTHKMHEQDHRNTNKAQQAANLILNLAEHGNVSAIALKGFWGTHGYYNATKTPLEGIHFLQTAANRHHPVALAWLGSYYRTGKHVSRDLHKSREYLELGSMLGHPYAVKELQKLNNGNTSSSDCFITTAVCTSFGKPDDCYELETFRWFRDNWLINCSDGNALIKEYYVIAPKIVDRINNRPNRHAIYEEIWNNYLRICLRLIENKEYVKCRKIYQQMVLALKEEYLPGHVEQFDYLIAHDE